MQENYQYYLNQKAVASHYLELGNVLKALEHFNNAYHTSFGTEDLDLMLDLAGATAIVTIEYCKEDYRNKKAKKEDK